VALLDESNPFVQDLPNHAAKSMGDGAHFVLLSERTDGHLPALANVRDQVRREWGNATRIEATDKFYQALLERYTIRIEPREEKKVAQVP